MKLKKIIATSLTMAMAFTLAPIAVPNQSKAATATITLSGSTSISPLAQQLAKQYAKENKGIKINFTNITGSGSGISDAMNGKVDIGMSSRALKADEAAVLKANVICNDGIAIVVNKSNPVGNITPEQQTGRALFLLTTRQQPYTDVNPVPEQEVVLKMF